MNIPEKHIQKILMVVALAFIGLILLSVQKCSAQLDITKRSVTVTENFYKNGDSVYTASELRQEINDSLSDFYIDVGTRISDTATEIRGYTDQEVNNLYDTLPFFSGEYDSLFNAPSLKDTIYKYEQDSSLARRSDISDSIATLDFSASNISVIDANNYFDSNNVEGVLYELGTGYYNVESSPRVIYVDTSGSDTNDGTSFANAYETIGAALNDIGYLNNGVIITIKIGLGSYNLSSIYADILCKKNGSGIIRFTGTRIVKYASVNHTTSGTFKTVINNIGGSPSGFTGNEVNEYFIRNNIDSTSYYNSDYLYHPIARSVVDTLDISGYFHTATVTGDIIDMGTTITIGASGGSPDNPSLSVLNNSLNAIEFRELKLYAVDYTLIGGIKGIGLRNVVTTNAGGFECFIFDQPSGLSMQGCIFDSRDRFINSIVKNSTFPNAVGLYVINEVILKNALFYGSTFSITNDANGTGIHVNFGLPESSIKFINVNRCFQTSSSLTIGQSENINWEFESVTSFIRNTSGSWDGFKIFLDGSKVMGSPTKWDYSNSTTFYRNNPNTIIYFKGLVYPDYEYNLSESLTNATQNDITVGDINQNSSIIIDYEIQRSTLFEEGQVRILYDGTNITYLQAPIQDNNSGAGIGVTFNVDFDAVDTDLINLEVTLDAGNDGTIKYDVKRKMQ